MADKEVQNAKGKVPSSGKKDAVSAAPGDSGKKPAKVTAASTPNKDPQLTQLLEVLRVMNENVVNQGARLDKQDERLEQVLGQANQGYTEEYLDYEDDVYENYDETEVPFDKSSESSHAKNDLLSDPETKSVFKKLSDKFNQTEVLDGAVHPDLASLVNTSFRNGLSDDKYEELTKEVHRPENCDSLVKTKVNQGIWRLLKPWTQAEDVKLTHLQGILLKATSSLLSLVEKLGSSDNDSESVEIGTTVIALLGHAFKTINVKRKDLHKNDLDSKYHYLASASLPYTDLLYGDDNDVNNNVKEINTMNRMGKTVGRGGSSYTRGWRGGRRGRAGRFAPYPSRGRGRGRGYQARSDSAPSTSGLAKNQPKQKQQ